MTLRIDPALPSVKLASLQKGLVLNMSLDQESYNPATKRFTDKTPYSNHGTSHNSANFTTDHMGQPNRAMLFNGTDDYVGIGTGVFNCPSAGTGAAWIKTSSSLRQTIFNQDTVGINPGDWRMEISVDGSFGGMPVDDNEWHYLVKSYDGTNAHYYVDGDLKMSPSDSGYIGNAAATVEIGNYYDGSKFTYCFNGSIPRVRIYNRALSADEITALHEMYRPKFLI